MKFLLGLAIWVLVSSPALAEYIAIGKITGQDCGVFTCSNSQVDAVKNDDGKLFSINRRWDSVSEYRNGKCWVNIGSKGLGILSSAINFFSGPTFLTKLPNGAYKEVKVETLYFKCNRIP